MFVEFMTPIKQHKITINAESISAFWVDELGTAISIAGRIVIVQENYEEVREKLKSFQ